MVFQQSIPQPLVNPFVHRGGRNEKEPLSAKTLTLQHITFVYELRKNAFADIFPIKPSCAKAWKLFFS